MAFLTVRVIVVLTVRVILLYSHPAAGSGSERFVHSRLSDWNSTAVDIVHCYITAVDTV